MTVEWFDATTETIIHTTDDLDWQITDVDAENVGTYYSVLTVDGCTSEVSNTQELSLQPGLEETTIFTNAEAGVSSVCEGEQVNLAVPFEEGVSYQWFGPNGIIENATNNIIIENASADISGAYYIVREKAGCTRESPPVAIQVTAQPTTPILAEVEGLPCFNGTVTLRIDNPQEMPGGNEVEYSWFHVQTNELVGTSTHPIFTLTNLEEANSGNYFVVLTVDGCSTSPSNFANIVVQEPSMNLIATASAGVDAPVCEGANINLVAPFQIGATYEWFGPNGFTSDTHNPNITEVSTEEAGNYYALITNSEGCSFLTTEIPIQVKSKPETPNLVIDDLQKCEGEAVQLTITRPTLFPENAGVTYQWFTTDSDIPIAETAIPEFINSNLSEANTGQYFAIINQDGCQSTVSNVIDLEVSTIPNEVAFISADAESACNQHEIQVEAIQPMLGIGQWTSSANLSFVNPFNPSTLLLDVPEGETKIYWTLSYKGCENYSRDSLVISQESALIEATDDEYTIDLNATLSDANVADNDLIMNTNQLSIQLMSEPENGQLTFENGRIQYEPNTNFFGEDVFAYEICAVNCPDQCDVATVRVKVIDQGIGIDCFAPNIITPNEDGRNDYLRIPCVESQEQSQLKVFNRWGDLVHETDNYRNDWAGTYKGSPLPNGTYFYLLQMEGMKRPMQGYFSIVR